MYLSKHYSSLLITLIISVLTFQCASAQVTITPVARTDTQSRKAHEQLVEKARKGGIDLYFVGDSITRRWGASDYPTFLENWNRNFLAWKPANFGWGGDTIQNILWRLQNGELDGVKPKVIVVLAGTNNIGKQSPHGQDEAKVTEVYQGIQSMLSICRSKAPQAVIILMAVTPRNDNPHARVVIEKINEKLAKLSDGKAIRFLNMNESLADKQGKLRTDMSSDGLHLSVKGYQVWADALKPLLTEILGPPR